MKPIILTLALAPTLCFGALSTDTSYFLNVEALTNVTARSAVRGLTGVFTNGLTAGSSTFTGDVTIGGVTRNDWPSSGGGTNMMVSTITYGTTISPTFAIGGLSTTAASCRRVTFRLTMTGDVTTINAPAGTLIDGDTMVWEVIQDATGSRLISGWDAKYAFGTDITGITLTTTASKRDFITFTYNSTADKWFVVGFVRGY